MVAVRGDVYGVGGYFASSESPKLKIPFCGIFNAVPFPERRTPWARRVSGGILDACGVADFSGHISAVKFDFTKSYFGNPDKVSYNLKSDDGSNWTGRYEIIGEANKSGKVVCETTRYRKGIDIDFDHFWDTAAWFNDVVGGIAKEGNLTVALGPDFGKRSR